jgi:hypothetical protein
MHAASGHIMGEMRKRLSIGLISAAAGLAVMELIRRRTQSLGSKRAPEPTDVFPTERSMSLIGLHHEEGESATDALGRIAYEKIAGREPSPDAKEKLSWAVHLAYGALVATGYSMVRKRSRHAVRDGVLFALGLWAFGDELAAPLLGLADKPTAYPLPRHVQSLAQHIGFGVTTASTTRLLERFL